MKTLKLAVGTILLSFIISNSFAQINTADGLIAWYSFNGNANDKSGNGQHGTVSGAALTTDRFGNPNSAYLFDGIDDHIDIGNDTILERYNADFTISAWIRVHSYNAAQYSSIVSNKENVSGSVFNVTGINHPDYTEGQMSLKTSEGMLPARASEILVTRFNWHFVAVTFKYNPNGCIATYYIDNKVAGVTVLQPVVNPRNNHTLIGAKQTTGVHKNLFFHGIIDDVRIFNKVLDPASLALQSYCSPLAEYSFEGNANDNSEYGNHGTVSGAMLTADRFSNLNSAYLFDGIDDYIDIGNDSSVRRIQDHTFAAWVKPNSFGNSYFKTIMSNRNPSGGSLIAFTGPDHRLGAGHFGLEHGFDAGTALAFTPDTVPLNVWTHIAVTFQNNTNHFILYINGEAKMAGQVFLNEGLITPDANTYIGSEPAYPVFGVPREGWPFDGIIDDLQIIGCVLDPNEVYALANNRCYHCPYPVLRMSQADEITSPVYPNPVANTLYLDAAAGTEVELCDMMGRVIYRGSSVSTIDMSEITSGFYLVRFKDGSGNITQIHRVVKE